MPGMSAQMEKIMQMMDQASTANKKIMEINGSHPLIMDLLKIYDKDANDPFLTTAAWRLFDSVLLLDGSVTDPHAMATGIQDLLADSTKLYNKDN